MKFSNVLPSIILFSFFSCQSENTLEAQAQAQSPPPPDSAELLQRWDNAWNQNDVESLQALLAENALLLLQGEKYSTEELNHWISENSATMKALKTDAVQQNAARDIAYQAGTYAHGLHENDSLHFTGTFTFVWERQQNNEWKIKVMNITELDPAYGAE